MNHIVYEFWTCFISIIVQYQSITIFIWELSVSKDDIFFYQIHQIFFNGNYSFFVSLTKNLDCCITEDWERTMQVNLNSSLYLIRDLYDAIPHNSRIIFIGSLMGVHPHGTSLAYGVSKAAVHALALNLVKSFEATDTTVNAIAPGFVETEWQASKPAEIRQNIYAKSAVKRFASPDEVADAVMFCVRNAFVNGSVLELSGGYSFK